MWSRQFLFALFVLCLSLLGGSDCRRRPCRCIEDQNSFHFGYFMCRSVGLRDLNILNFEEKQCVNVSVASLEDNKFTDYPALLQERRFTTINLQRNKLRYLPRVYQLSRNVKSLDVSWNKISDSSDELSNMNSLRTLLISGNSLRSLQFLPDPCSLEELDVSSNALTGIEDSLRQCHALTKLNMAKNSITSLPEEAFLGLRYLETLNLGQNPLVLTDGTFIGLSYLRRLSLKHTLSADISRTMFTGLALLDYLDLSSNKISWLPQNAFREIPNISALILDDNLLTELPDHLLSNHNRLKLLSLRNNKFIPFPGSIILEDRNSFLIVDLKENLISALSLRWILPMNDIHKHIDEEDNRCGYISRQNVSVRFCINTVCAADPPATCADWLNDVRLMEDILGPVGDDSENRNFAR